MWIHAIQRLERDETRRNETEQYQYNRLQVDFEETIPNYIDMCCYHNQSHHHTAHQDSTHRFHKLYKRKQNVVKRFKYKNESFDFISVNVRSWQLVELMGPAFGAQVQLLRQYEPPSHSSFGSSIPLPQLRTVEKHQNVFISSFEFHPHNKWHTIRDSYDIYIYTTTSAVRK
jgi:hypothetical protein